MFVLFTGTFSTLSIFYKSYRLVLHFLVAVVYLYYTIRVFRKKIDYLFFGSKHANSLTLKSMFIIDSRALNLFHVAITTTKEGGIQECLVLRR